MRYSKYIIFISTLIFEFISQGISLASYHEIETQYDTNYSHLTLSLTHTTTSKNGCLKKQELDNPTFSSDEIRKGFPTRLLYFLEKNLGISSNPFEDDELGQQLPLLSPAISERTCDKRITFKPLSHPSGYGKSLLDYEFTTSSLKAKAFQPRTTDFERLEFLGDRVLGLITADLLCNHYSLQDVGQLAENFKIIVSKSSLTQMYKDFHIDPSELLSLNYQPPVDGCIAEKTSSDIVESLMGAIYKDGGFEVVKNLTELLIRKHYNLVNRRKINTLTKTRVLPTSSKKPCHFRVPQGLDCLQRMISYPFKDPCMLNDSLRHPSVGGNLFQGYDFIGIHVLALVVADKVFTDDPYGKEGVLNDIFKSIIENDNLEKTFQSWQIWRYLAKQHGGLISATLSPERIPKRMAASTVRALIGAVYLDGGWESAQSVTLTLLFSTPSETFESPKDKLQRMRSLLLVASQNNKGPRAFKSDNLRINKAPSSLLQLKEWPPLAAEKDKLPIRELGAWGRKIKPSNFSDYTVKTKSA